MEASRCGRDRPEAIALWGRLTPNDLRGGGEFFTALSIIFEATTPRSIPTAMTTTATRTHVHLSDKTLSLTRTL